MDGERSSLHIACLSLFLLSKVQRMCAQKSPSCDFFDRSGIMRSPFHRSGSSNVVLASDDESNWVDSWSSVCVCACGMTRRWRMGVVDSL